VGFLGDKSFVLLSAGLKRMGASFKIPSFLGILLFSIISNNIWHYVDIEEEMELLNTIRIISLVTILYRIGWKTDMTVIKDQFMQVFFLSVVPNLCEVFFKNRKKTILI
jgi:hypothetical protein